MSRADRLFALYYYLDTRSGKTLAELARRFEVSQRTIFRDLSTLEQCGVAIDHVDGRYRRRIGGGRPLALDSGELELVRLSLSNPALEKRRGQIARALRKLRDRLDSALRARAREPTGLGGLERTGAAAAGSLSGGERPFVGQGKHEIVLRFAPALAALSESARHHPGEEKRRRPDGSIEYRVHLSSLEEIARWVVGFGGEVRVEAPPELVRRVHEIARGALAPDAPAGESGP